MLRVKTSKAPIRAQFLVFGVFSDILSKNQDKKGLLYDML